MNPYHINDISYYFTLSVPDVKSFLTVLDKSLFTRIFLPYFLKHFIFYISVIHSNPLGLTGLVSNSTQHVVTGTMNLAESTKDLITNARDTIDEAAIDIIYNGLVVYEETNVEIPLMRQTIQKLKIPTNVFRKNIKAPIANTGVCIGCAAALKYFIIRSRLGLSRNRLVDMLVFACTLFNVESERVCRGAVELNIVSQIKINLKKYKLR